MNDPTTSRWPDLWRRAATLFEHAVELPEAERSSFLDRVCAADLLLREAVDELLAFDEDNPEKATSFPSSVAPGRRLGAYQLLHPIAQGGMASVWLAERCGGDVEQQVAIKWIPQLDGAAHPWTVPLFRRERQILARLEHPNIARFLDGGTTEEGLPYAVLEYVLGVPITRYCDERRLDVRVRIALFGKVCGAVRYAHQNLIVHRDLKPDNILVGDDGEPKLLDFGIARSLLPSRPTTTAPTARTTTAGRFLTFDYASPEQIAGAPVSMATDTYSLGVLLHQLLTGCLPIRPEGATPESPSDLALKDFSPEGHSAEARSAARALSPRRLSRRLRGDLDAIVLRCLRLEPSERYGSVEQLAEDLERQLAGLPVLAQPPSFRYRSVKFLRRHKVAAAAGSILALAAVGFVLMTLLYSRRLERERDASRAAQEEAEAVQGFLLDAFRNADPYQRSEVGATEPHEPTVREMLDRSSERVAIGLKDRPLVQARLYQSLGGVYLNLGRYPQALPLLRQSLALRQAHLGPNHPEVEISLALLGHALYTVGQLEEAEPVMRESLRLAQTLPQTSPQLLAEALTNYGMLEDDRGRLPEARAALEQALSVYRRFYTEEQGGRPLAIVSIQLGGVLYQLKSYPEGQKHLREALRILHGQGLREHPDIASALHYLARIEQAEGHLDPAEALYTEALAMRIKVQGPDHPQTVVARGALDQLVAAKRKDS